MSGLVVRNVSKAFGAFEALTGVSIEISSGHLACLLGPSGCGKTTLLRIVAGLDEPSNGAVYLDGQKLSGVPAHRREFGMVFQSLALFPHLSVAENIAYPLAIRGASRKTRASRVREMLELVRLQGLGKRRIHQLSGGQRQRVAIARGLALKPRLFLLDEPLSALDAKLREHMQVELRQLQQRLGITTILVTHDQREAMTLADHVIVMDNGKALQSGPPLEIYRHPVNSFVAEFIGRTNLIPCRRRGDRLIVLGSEVHAGSVADQTTVGQQETVLSVRPEHVRLCAADKGVLTGAITFVRDLGSEIEVSIAVGDIEILSSMPASSFGGSGVGDRVGVAIEFSQCNLLSRDQR
ncbi:MAG: ABC transporter ATP-binding protein [Rhodobacteraceae bacterium]|nr:ABC transporter ATP-binding protein [Paracoccaceae bacterium]